MTTQCNVLPPPPPQENWREELSRAKRFREANEKRNAEKQVNSELDPVKRRAILNQLVSEFCTHPPSGLQP